MRPVGAAPSLPAMLIRDERPGDRTAVRGVLRRAFGDHGRTVADLADSLREAAPGRAAGIALVAESDGQVVGQVMFTAALLDAPARLVEVLVLSPLAVDPAHQRRGIGSALVRAGQERSAARAVPLVFLEGDPRYYCRFGFTAAGDLGFRKPSLRIPDAAFQVLRLPGYEPGMTGSLVYPEPFWRHDCVGLRHPGTVADPS